VSRYSELKRRVEQLEHAAPFLFERVEDIRTNLGRPGDVSVAADQCGCGYCYCHGGGCSCAMCLAMPAELPQITERVIAARPAMGATTLPAAGAGEVRS
jgi:hypothetical protein